MKKITAPIRYHCEQCGGNAVRSEGRLRWSESRQEWELIEVKKGHGYCLTCESPTNLVAKPIEDRDLAGMRKALGLKQAQLGALMGMGANEVSRVERGDREPPKRYRKLLEAYVAGYRPPHWPG